MRGTSVVLVGGIGRMETTYRLVAQRLGYRLDYYEQSSPRLTTDARPAAVIIMHKICSHPQKMAAERLAESAGCPRIFLASASASRLRRVLEDLPLATVCA